MRVLARERRGFTLIELLVVIAVIAILAAILFPVFARVRERARQASCLANHRQINLAVRLYIDDYDERFWSGKSIYGLVFPGPEGTWEKLPTRCCGDAVKWSVAARANIAYADGHVKFARYLDDWLPQKQQSFWWTLFNPRYPLDGEKPCEPTCAEHAARDYGW